MLLLDFLRTIYTAARLGITPGSIAQYGFAVRQFSHFLGHDARLADLTELTVRAFLADYRAHFSASTTNVKRAELLSLWRVAVDEGLLPTLPNARKIPRLRAPVPMPEAWTTEEVGRILRAARASPGLVSGLSAAAWWESLLLVAYDTGERRGALLAARTSDLSITGWIAFVATKTGQPRHCPLSDQTLAACRVIYDRARSLIWPWPQTRQTFDAHLMRILLAAGVSFGRAHGGLLHKMRKTTGTLIETNGGDGAAFIGNSRRVFEAHYLDRRFCRNDLCRLPRPTF